MLGSANFKAGPLMAFMSGNLCYQIEHHLFPDLPSNRYAEISERITATLRQVRPALHDRIPWASVHADVLDHPEARAPGQVATKPAPTMHRKPTRSASSESVPVSGTALLSIPTRADAADCGRRYANSRPETWHAPRSPLAVGSNPGGRARPGDQQADWSNRGSGSTGRGARPRRKDEKPAAVMTQSVARWSHTDATARQRKASRRVPPFRHTHRPRGSSAESGGLLPVRRQYFSHDGDGDHSQPWLRTRQYCGAVSDEAVYAFRFDTDGDRREDMSFKMRFGDILQISSRTSGSTHAQKFDVYLSRSRPRWP